MHQYSFVDLSPADFDKKILETISTAYGDGSAEVAPEKIFIARRSITAISQSRYRALLNEDELIAALSERGFSIVEPELLPFEAQVALFQRAKLVVGLGGAGMFNLVFSPPGTKVVTIESSTAFVNGHANLFGSLQHKYGVILGRQDLTDQTPVQKRWTIDVPRAVKAIEDFG